MRNRDEQKQEAVIEATIKVVNQVGFSSASISKIAKEAAVSQGTIYIYYENKEDLVVSVYYNVKQRITGLLNTNITKDKSVEANLKTLWYNIINSGNTMPDLFSYSDQFSNSPFYDLIDKNIIFEYAKPIITALEEGKATGVIKDLSFELFIAFFFTPAHYLSNRKICVGFELNEKNIEESYQLAWSTIKL